MLYDQLFKKATTHFEKNLPFVLFSLPGKNLIKAIFQKETQSFVSTNFSQESFVMAPFRMNGKILQIPYDASAIFECEMPHENLVATTRVSIHETDEDRKKHLDLVTKTIAKIATGSAQKIVVSRCKKFTLKNFNLATLCDSLFTKYKDAFRYVWYHPETDIWCGATPEVLVETKALHFNTMALAGTQKIDNKIMINWTAKEKREQQWVTDAIIESLETKTSVLKVSKTETHIAGNLAHLKTNISGTLNSSRARLEDITKALHPTPAVCGTPRNLAMKFIEQHEGYNRTFYTGFLGPVCELQQSSKLFVNLRSLSIKDNVAILYAGGGITIDSSPEGEWEETQNKLQTMAKVIEPLL